MPNNNQWLTEILNCIVSQEAITEGGYAEYTTDPEDIKYGNPLHNKAELEKAILQKISEAIGENEPDETDKWTPEMESYIRQARQVIYGRNALRAEQRAKLKGDK